MKLPKRIFGPEPRVKTFEEPVGPIVIDTQGDWPGNGLWARKIGEKLFCTFGISQWDNYSCFFIDLKIFEEWLDQHDKDSYTGKEPQPLRWYFDPYGSGWTRVWDYIDPYEERCIITKKGRIISIEYFPAKTTYEDDDEL